MHPLHYLAVFILVVLCQLATPDSYGQSPSYGPQGIVVGDTLLRFIGTVESNGVMHDSYGGGYWIRPVADAPGELVWSEPPGDPGSAVLKGYYWNGGLYSWVDPTGVVPSEPLENVAAWDPANNGPSVGPTAVYLHGRTFQFSHNSAYVNGGDVYLSPLGGYFLVRSEPTEFGYAVYASGPLGGWSGYFSGGVFASELPGPIFAIDNEGNLVGSPAGILASFPTEPGAVSLEVASGGPSQTAYVWEKPDQSWGAKVILSGLPGLFRMHAENPDYGSSPIHYWLAPTAGNFPIGGIGSGETFEWWGSSLAPSLIYVGSGSGVSALQYSSQGMDSSTGLTNVLYSSGASGDRELVLAWDPNAGVEGFTGSWTYSEYFWDTSAPPQWVLGPNESGLWDGMNRFYREGEMSVVISRNPPRQGPEAGPARILLDGIALNFDPNASFMSGGDSYVSADFLYRATLYANGTTHFTVNGLNVFGTYDLASRRFSFSSFAGVVLGLGVGETLEGDLPVTGSLDVYGSTFNFATDGINPNKPAFAWLHQYGPISAGWPNGNRLRWLTATANYEWTWEAPVGASLYSPVMALRSHPFPTLALSVPITNPSGQVVIGPYNDTSVDSSGDRRAGVFVVGAGTGPAANQRRNAMRVLADGTVLVRPSGDISMGEFAAGPQP